MYNRFQFENESENETLGLKRPHNFMRHGHVGDWIGHDQRQARCVWGEVFPLNNDRNPPWGSEQSRGPNLRLPLGRCSLTFYELRYAESVEIA